MPAVVIFKKKNENKKAKRAKIATSFLSFYYRHHAITNRIYADVFIVVSVVVYER